MITSFSKPLPHTPFLQKQLGDTISIFQSDISQLIGLASYPFKQKNERKEGELA